MSYTQSKPVIVRSQRCSNCNFGVEGDCRRHPPKIVYTGSNAKQIVFQGFWPTVQVNDWCGEWCAEQTPK